MPTNSAIVMIYVIKKVIKNVYALYRYYYKKLKIAFLSLIEAINPPSYGGHLVPPPRMRELTTADHITVSEHIRNGLQAAKMVQVAVEAEGVKTQIPINVLEFGCGCGRVLRHLHNIWPNANLSGSDIDKELIGWVRKNLSDTAQWHINNYLPPCSFSSQSFDVIYLISVFTHMEEKSQFLWLEEYNRILKPGGLLLITVHEIPKNQKLKNDWNGQYSEGIKIRYRSKEVVQRAWVGERNEHHFYFDAQHSADYCKSKWGQIFDFCGFYPKLLREAQALVILRKKG